MTGYRYFKQKQNWVNVLGVEILAVLNMTWEESASVTSFEPGVHFNLIKDVHFSKYH